MPPRVWQSLWCKAMPTEPRQMPANHAPYNAWLRACASLGSLTTPGKAWASERIDSSAMKPMIGLASSAYSASTAWAMAFMPEQAEICAGRVRVNCGS
ncbi:hypothetical protein D3C84_1067510 [compost metagenome]